VRRAIAATVEETMRRRDDEPTMTPWGYADSVKSFGDGVKFYSTPAHGGYHVDHKLLDHIPLGWREATVDGQGHDGWFEEDCDWCMVVLSFADRFPATTVDDARRTFAYWFAADSVAQSAAAADPAE
jgi:hypothetical protein